MKPGTRSFYETAVLAAVAHVVSNLDRALDLEALARLAALSPFHFHRIFRGMLGETPLELHRRLRLERAAWTLSNTEAPVTEIAFAAGYETHESFTRAFRASYSSSPSEFREQWRTPGEPGCKRPPQSELAARSALHFSPGISTELAFPILQGGETMNVEIRDTPALRLATLRHVGPYNRISEAFARLGTLVNDGELPRSADAMLAVFYDDPETTPALELRSDAALAIPEGVQIPAGLEEQRLPAGRCAVHRHVGPYEELGDVWARLMGEWLPQSGHRVKDAPAYEIYRNTPADVPKQQLVTELCVPLAS